MTYLTPIFNMLGQDMSDVNFYHKYEDMYPKWYLDNPDYIDELIESLNLYDDKKGKKNFKKLNIKSLNDKIYKLYQFKTKSDLEFENNNIKPVKVTRCDSYIFYPNDDQKEILKKWFDECIELYNNCVDINNENENYFDYGYKAVKTDVFLDMYGDQNKPAPYDMLTDVIREFCSNKKSAETNLANGNIKKYELKYRTNPKCMSMLIPKTSVLLKEDKKDNNKLKGYVYGRKLGFLKGLENIPNNITHDCRIVHDRLKNKYFLKVPHDVLITKPIIRDDRDPLAALDPGEKAFIAFHSAEKFGFLGDNIRQRILEEEAKIRRFQRILSRGKNRKGGKIRKAKIIKKIRKIYRRISNIVKDLHNKTALYLCKTFKTVLIPEFKTKGMISKDRGNFDLKEHINDIKDNKGKDEAMTEIRRITKKRRLNGRVKFCLQQLSHYKFRQHLIAKGEEYGCDIKIVTEEYTTKTCPRCMVMSNEIEGRTKRCTECGYKCNRDIVGSRNIYVKEAHDNNIKI